MEILNRYAIARKRMVNEQLITRKIRDTRVLSIMSRLPRHFFVEDALQDQAYRDYPVNIGSGQTISQPYIVALMTEALQLKGNEKILEIGTGCGYQTALLAHLVAQVYTIERIKSLGLQARRRLKDLGLKNIIIRIGDGSLGWPEAQPFDGILIAAGAPEIPMLLLNQLAEGGKLVLPIGSEETQTLLRLTKKRGRILKENLGPCRFVKLVGRFGWGE